MNGIQMIFKKAGVKRRDLTMLFKIVWRNG